MKKIIQICSLIATAAVFQGCAGYNTVMFATKSNVGLDVDTKTPTAEITVARKEFVAEPAFEGGQTPPVMASFKPHAGFTGSFQNFFVGVDQTFAGGDPAVIMSTLYSKPDASWDSNKFSSTLNLSTAPTSKWPTASLPKPGKTRPFIFMTDTMLGLKIVWSGTSGEIPDSVKIGYNRKEFAWAPLTMKTRADNSAQISIPSFMATIESKTEVNNGTNGTNGISALQYFATGDAARQLALKQDVRSAMLARLDPNAKDFKLNFGGQGSEIAREVLFAMNSLFNEIRNEDGVANKYYTNFANMPDLNLADFDKTITYVFTESTNMANNTLFSLDKGDKLQPTTQNTLKNNVDGLDYVMKRLDSNLESLAAASGVLNTNLVIVQFVDTVNSTTNVFSNVASVERPIMQQQIKIQTALNNSLQNYISTNETIIQAYQYYLTLVQPK
jgi:hypothetical protein